MLEEIIDASPNRINHSIRQKIEHRKHKRKRLDEVPSNISISSNISEDNIKIFNSQLFYAIWDSENEENEQDSTFARENEQLKQSSNNYERFKAEVMLAMADQGSYQIPKRSLEPTQMFQTCERLIESQQNLNTTEYLSFENEAEGEDCFDVQTECFLETFEVREEDQVQANQELDETLKPKSQNETNNNFNEDFDDSTFLNENILTNTSPAVSKKNNKTIVEQIHEDFCASLSSSSEDETKFIDIEPYFRFRKKRLRTYERCFRRPAVASAVINAVVPPVENEDLQFSDTSSELSVQEANTQSIPPLEPLELNYRSPMHNNLLNLSAFFTQNLLEINCDIALENKTWSSSSAAMISDDESKQSTIETETDDDVPFNLFNEVQTLRLKFENFSKPVLCENSNDLLGFASTTEQAARLAQMKAGLSSVAFDQCPRAINETLETIPDVEFKAESNLPQAPPISCDVENSTFDDETWQHDSEFFINFRTQAVLKSQKPQSSPSLSKEMEKSTAVLDTTNRSQEKSSEFIVDDVLEQSINEKKKSEPYENLIKFDFNDMVLSEWPLDVYAEEAETVNIKAKEELPVVNNDDVVVKDELLAELFEENEDFWNEPFTQLYQLEVSTENKKSAEQSLKKTTEIPIENESQPCTSKQAAILYSNRSTLTDSSTKIAPSTSSKTTAETFLGFSTASSKQIIVSDAARRKAEQIFAELPEFPKEKANSNSFKDRTLSNAEQSTSEKCKFSGFQTASSKPINISEKAQKKYQNIFDEILKEDDCNSRKEQVNSDSSFKQKALPVVIPSESLKQQSSSSEKCKFPGFQTASSNPINISEKAQKKYENFFDKIFKENEEEPNIKIEHTKEQLAVSIGLDFQDMQLSEWLPGNKSPNSSTSQHQPKTQSPVETSAKAVASPTKRKFRNLENTTHRDNEQRTKKLCRSFTTGDISIGTPSPRRRSLRASLSDMRTPSVIARNNLLSLAKKRKSMLEQTSEHYENNNNDPNQIETPVKLGTTTVENTPSVLEFNARLPNAATSTPHERPNRRLNTLKSSENLDSDFKRINWEQSEDEKSNSLNLVTTTTLVATPTRAENSTQNETLKTVPPPSPQERIENLSFCGDPPRLPQIVTNSANRNRCLGLSRPRRRNLKKN